jgi:hypothetical protein
MSKIVGMLTLKNLLSFLLILILSTPIVNVAIAAPLAVSDKDWHYVNGNSWAWNYSPQTQINKSNVDQLEVKWIFPIEGTSVIPEALKVIHPQEGVTTPPLVNDGIVYIQTNFLKTYAINGSNGKSLWTHEYTLNIPEIQERLPWSANVRLFHLHGIRYWESGKSLLLQGFACDFYGLDGQAGTMKFHITDLCANIPGNLYKYSPTSEQNSIGTYERGRQFIFLLSHVEGGGWTESGRNIAMGIDMDTNSILWRVFNSPPQGEFSRDWALQECNLGFFRDIPCSDVAELVPENLEWDWAPAPNTNPHPSSGVTASWGQPVIDEDSGILYINTGAQVPWPNVSLTTGPRLYGSTIMAIDMNQGKRVWWQQPQPRDPYDFDCNWSGMLIDHISIGKVYVKGCKDGHWIVSNARTGEPIHIIQVMDEIYPEKRTFHITDPFSWYDMKEFKQPDRSLYHGEPPITLVPSYFNGAFSTDQSFDPQTGTVYHYTAFTQLKITTLPMREGRISGVIPITNLSANVTIVARDLFTEKIKWSWFYPISNQRAHMVVSGGMLFSGFTDGNMRFFDKDSGILIDTLRLGSPIVTGVTMGQDSEGHQKIFTIVGATSFARQESYGLAKQNIVPGTLIAIGISENIPNSVTTTVITTTTVSTTTTVTHFASQNESAFEIIFVYIFLGLIAFLLVAMTVLLARKKGD